MTAPRLSAVLAIAVPLLFAACGSDNLTLPGEGEPAHIAMFAGNGQSARVGTQLPPLVALVTDTKDRPVAGATVQFAFDDAAGGSIIAPPSAVTTADGKASATITLGDQVGVVNGHASVTVPQGATPLSVAFTATAQAADASGIEAVSGDGQTGQVGSQLGLPLVVKVTDPFGNPIAGAAITWSITGGGSVGDGSSSGTSASTQTGPDGTTSVIRILGTTAGPQTTKATAEALTGSPSVTFTHTATAGSAARVDKFAGDGQSGLAGAELTDPLVVQVLDAQGNPVVGRAVTWVIGAGGGSVDPQNTTTDSQGKASTHWTLGTSVGTNTVNAVVSGVGTATFTATANAGSVSPSKSTASASPRSITAGASSSTITVRVKDGNGTAIAGVSVTASSSGAENTFDPTSATTDGSGLATLTFSSTVAETKTITVVAGGVTLNQKPTVTVIKAPSLTRITGRDLATPTQSGSPVHVTFSVTSGLGGGTPTGQVTILSEQEPSASCTVDVSAGACDLTLTAVGNHHLIATYSGDARFEDSSDDDSHQVVPAPNPPPTAAFTHDDCFAGSNCQFHDGSSDSNGSVVAWSWDFGDIASGNNSSTEQNPMHSFSLGSGTHYTVTLTVTDNQGATNSTSQDVVAQ